MHYQEEGRVELGVLTETQQRSVFEVCLSVCLLACLLACLFVCFCLFRLVWVCLSVGEKGEEMERGRDRGIGNGRQEEERAREGQGKGREKGERMMMSIMVMKMVSFVKDFHSSPAAPDPP